MKVLLIADTLNVRGGWGRYATSVVEETLRRGVECVVISDLPAPTFQNALKNILKVRKAITKDIDIIHAFDCWPLAVYAALANIGRRKPLFITGVGTYSVPPEGVSIKSGLMRYAYKKAREVFCISHYSMERIRERAPDAHYTIVHWGTTALPIPNAEQGRTYQEQFTIPHTASPIILTVGEIKHRKGQLDTLKAVEILKKKYPNILYIALGSAADVSYVESMRGYAKKNNLEGSFKIVDNCKENMGLAFFYNLADIFAMNSNNEHSHFEGFGLVFLEAAQFGKPAVGSRGCGIEDAISDGHTGFLTTQGDSRDIADKLGKLLSGDIKKFGAQALEYSRGFTWQKTVDHHIESYKHAL